MDDLSSKNLGDEEILYFLTLLEIKKVYGKAGKIISIFQAAEIFIASRELTTGLEVGFIMTKTEDPYVRGN